MREILAKQAFNQLIKGRPYSTWASSDLAPGGLYQLLEDGHGGQRIYSSVPALKVKAKFQLPPDAAFFASGSCFAREIEWYFVQKGRKILSWSSLSTIDSGLFNRYTTHAILGEFYTALGGSPYNEDNIVKFGQRWMDFTGHGHAETRQQMLTDRLAINDVFKRAAEADVIFLTLGLVEAWYDRETDRYLNIPPWGNFSSDRYVLRVTDYAENRRAMEEFVLFMRQTLQPDLKFVITVSPVPLEHTFSGTDIILANAYSKSTLRAVAQDIADGDPLIDYFPSYEMVTLAAPDVAWHPDRRHVRREFVEKIMQAFDEAYLPQAGADGTANMTPHSASQPAAS